MIKTLLLSAAMAAAMPMPAPAAPPRDDPAPASFEIRGFSGGYAAFRHQELWGFLDRAGRVAVEPRFAEVDRFSDGLAAASAEGLWGYVDTRGAWAIEPRFTRAHAFHQGAAVVILDQRAVLIDRQGHVLKRFPDGVGVDGEFRRGHLHARLHPPRMMRHEDGRGFALPGEVNSPDVFSEGLLGATARTAEGERYGYLDEKGAWAIPPDFLDGGRFRGGVAKAADADTQHVGLIDRRGRWIVPPEHELVAPLANGLWGALLSGTKAPVRLFDDRGRPVADIPCRSLEAPEPPPGWLILSGCEKTWLLGRDKVPRSYGFETKRTVSGGGVLVLLGVTYRETAAAAPEEGAGEPASEAADTEDSISSDRESLAQNDGFAVVDASGATLASSDDPALRRFMGAHPAQARGEAGHPHRPMAVLHTREHDGLALVGADGRLIEHPDWRGRFPIGDGALSFDDRDLDGPIPMPSDRGWGAVDARGRWVIEPEYDFLSQFHRGLAYAVQGEHGFMLDADGRRHEFAPAAAEADAGAVSPTTPADYERLRLDPASGWVKAAPRAGSPLRAEQQDGLWGLMKEDGTWALPPAYAEPPLQTDTAAGFWLLSDRPPATDLWNRDSVYGLADAAGRVLLAPRFHALEVADDGLLRFSPAAGLRGLMTPAGKTLVPADYTSIEPGGEGWYLAEPAPRYGLLDARGEWAVGPGHLDLRGFETGDATRALVDGESVLIDRTGRVSRATAPLQPASDDSAHWWPVTGAGGGTVFLGFDWRARLSVPGGIEPGEDQAVAFHEGVAAFRPQGEERVGLIDDDGRVLTPARYDAIGPMSEGMAAARRLFPLPSRGEPAAQARSGYLDRSGRLVLTERFLEAGAFSGGYAPVATGDSVGLIDRRGRWLVRNARRCGQTVLVDADGVPLWPKNVSCAGRSGPTRNPRSR